MSFFTEIQIWPFPHLRLTEILEKKCDRDDLEMSRGKGKGETEATEKEEKDERKYEE
jgi:hypothetical protein